jgi:RNA polymerase sigma factor (sigma-70 family)
MEAHGAPLGARIIRRRPRRLTPAGDDRLARLVGAGSEEAFAVLYERYHQRLYRYCRSMLGNDPDAQDALQSAFAGAFEALAAGRRDAPVRPWLYRIAHNEAVSILRRRRPEVDLEAIETPSTPSAADMAGERERLTRLVEDLRRLTERQRSALVMRELSGLSHEEIGVALGTDASGAKQTIFEARRSLQEFVEGREMGCEEVCQAISAGGGRTLRARRIRSHLRECTSCHAFAAAIPSRSRDLRAVSPPLAAAAATGILRRALSSSGHGSSGGAGLAGAAGKAAALSVAGKTVTGAAVLATVAAGAAGVVHIVSNAPPSAPLTGIHELRSVTDSAGTVEAGLAGRRGSGSTTLTAHRFHKAGASSSAHGRAGVGSSAKRGHSHLARLGQGGGRSRAARGSGRARGTDSQSLSRGKPHPAGTQATSAGQRSSGRSSPTSTSRPTGTGTRTQAGPTAGSSAPATNTTGSSAVGGAIGNGVKNAGLAKSLH